VEAPIATFTGWNLRRSEFTQGDICDGTLATGAGGSMIPVRRTRSERLAVGDPRPSLEEMYGDHMGYVVSVASAALRLWDQRLLLTEDVYRVIEQADQSDILR
jgi:hypothetical protein